MKHLVIVGDGMADHAVARLGGRTPMQHAKTPWMDLLARMGRTGRLVTIPEGFAPGSEVANTSILGYDPARVYEGRGPLEAAGIGYKMAPGDLAMRCNIVTLSDRIENHHGGHLATDEGRALVSYLNGRLGNDIVRFVGGTQYRHLLVVRGGNKHVECAPPHDNPGRPWRPLLARPERGWEDKRDGDRMTASMTAEILNDLTLKSQALLARHPLNLGRVARGEAPANSIWPWGGGYRPAMETIGETYPGVRTGAVISAVDLIRGIGRYAGLRAVMVPGATGLADTNYEGKASAAIEALRTDDFVYLHVEASDEAGHDGDLELKVRTIEDLDGRVVGPIFREVGAWRDDPVCIAVLPDHPTPVELRTHVGEPVPFLVWHPGIEPDGVTAFDEASCAAGGCGLLRGDGFMRLLMGTRGRTCAGGQ